MILYNDESLGKYTIFKLSVMRHARYLQDKVPV